MYLPPRKVEVVDEKPASIFAAKPAKPAAPQPVEEGEHLYKAFPALVAIIEPIANQFMPLPELIDVRRALGDARTHARRFWCLETTLARPERVSRAGLGVLRHCDQQSESRERAE